MGSREIERIKETERITPKQAVVILQSDGIEVTEIQAKIILDFMYEMAEIVIEQYLDGEE